MILFSTYFAADVLMLKPKLGFDPLPNIFPEGDARGLVKQCVQAPGPRRAQVRRDEMRKVTAKVGGHVTLSLGMTIHLHIVQQRNSP
jgi:hypothetical protein